MQKMGNLKPGAEYVYEQQDGITYAREKNASINSRVEIGWEYDTRTSDGRPLHDHMMDDKLWGEIRREARTNPTLQKTLDRAILIYQTIKDERNE
jgi:hypothetical protein